MPWRVRGGARRQDRAIRSSDADCSKAMCGSIYFICPDQLSPHLAAKLPYVDIKGLVIGASGRMVKEGAEVWYYLRGLGTLRVLSIRVYT